MNDPIQRSQAMDAAVEQYMTVWRESSDPKRAAEKLVPLIKTFKEQNLDTLPIFQLAIRRNPADMPLTLYVAEKQIEQNANTPEAVQCYRRSLQSSPKPLPYYLALEDIYRNREDTVNLSFIYEQFFYQYQKWDEANAGGQPRLDPQEQLEADGMFERALPALVDFYVASQRRDARIIPVLEHALSRFAESVEVIELLAMIYLQDNRTDDRALETYETLLAYKQDCLPVIEKLADHYCQADRQAEALPLYGALYEQTDQQSKRLAYLNSIVETALALPQLPREAASYLWDYLKHNPNDDKARLALGKHCAAENNLNTNAVGIYNALAKKNMATPEMHALLGRHAFESRNWIDVIDAFEKQYRTNQNNPDIVFPLAEAYCEFDRTDAIAIAVYESAVKLGSTNRAIFQMLSKLYFDNNITSSKAIRCYKETLARAGGDLSARLGLCLCHLSNHEYEACFEEVARLIMRHPDHKEGIRIAAHALAAAATPAMIDALSRLDTPLQKKLLEAASEKKKHKTLVVKLAELYIKEGDPTIEHRAILEEALNYSPRNENLLEVLSRMAHRAGDWMEALHWDTKLYEVYVSRRSAAAINSTEALLMRHASDRICRRLANLLLEHDVAPDPAISTVFQDAWAAGMKDERLLRRLARQALDEDNTSAEAEQYYRALLKLEPGNEDVQIQLQMCNLESRRLDEVLEFCESQLREGRFDKRLLQLLLQSQTQSHQAPESLINLVDKLWIQNKDNSQLLLCLAHLFASAERYSERAIEIYQQALEIEPGNTFLIARLAKAFETTGNVEQSIVHYQQVLETLPEDAEILARLAQAYYYHKDTSDTALKTTQRAAEANPGNPKVAIHLAHLYFRRGLYRQAVEVIEQLVQRLPDAVPRAVACMEDLVAAIDPENADANLLRLRLGQLYLLQGKTNEAFALFTRLDVHYESYCGELIEGYSQVIAKDPTHAPARVERAVLFKLVGDYEAAINDLETILDYIGDDNNVLYELLEIYELVIASDKSPSRDLIFKAGSIAMQIEEYDKAIALFQKILHRDRHNYPAMLAVGKCFHRKGALEIALKYYHQVEKDDEVLDLLYHLADLAYSNQQRHLAHQALNEIISVDIAYRDASRRVAELEAELPQNGDNTAAKNALASDETARRFDLLNVIGKGSMGVVYRAYDRELSEHVALKVLPAEFNNHPEALERFRSEARAARRLTHRNIVRIHDIGEEGGQRFISMELIDGQNLRSLIRTERKIPPARTIPIAVQVAKALQYAHSHNILHRDIKPANILLTPNFVVKLTDFGIAAMVEEFTRTVDTSDIILGTPLYMAPEQAEGRVLSFASEVYSLGIVIFEMLRGEPPFTTGNIIYHHIFTPPAPLDHVPPGVAAVVMKCLEKKPENRYPTMDKLIEALQRVPLH